MLEETKPPVTTVTRKVVGEEVPEHPMTLANIAIVALIVCIGVPLMLVIGHALPLLDCFFQGMKPLMGYLGFGTGIAILVLIGLSLWYVHDWFRVDIKKRVIEARKFKVDPMSGNYDAYFDTNKMFAIPKPGVMVPPVPQTYAPQLHFINRASAKKDDELAEVSLLGQGSQRPSAEELASKIERNSLQIGLGRSLTTPENLLIADLADAHLKIIGSSRMGKSCEAGAIMAQVERTHDPERLQFALLDLEYKTSRLFEKSHHLAVLDIGRGNQGLMHAKSIDEVPTYLHYLVQELERRDRIASYQDVEKLPHILIYLEEFLDLKKRLKLQGGKVCAQFLTDFNTLATRGLKLGLHIMACAQVDYADDDLKDAMAQFIGVNIAFGVKPSAAMAAGFINSDLLSQNYANRQAGQFVVEMIGTSDIGIAPDYDVKAKLKALHETQVLGPKKTIVLDVENGEQGERNQEGNQNALASQAILAEHEGDQWVIENFQWKLVQLIELLHENQDVQFKHIWAVSPGQSREYRKAKAERTALIKHAQSLLKQ